MVSMVLKLTLLLLTETVGTFGDAREQILQDFDLTALSSDALQNTAPGGYAVQNGFGVAAESGAPVRDAGSDGLINVPGLPQLPSTELEAEVRRTSRVAAFLAQDAAVLSKELATLQASLRGHGLETLPVKEQNQLTSVLSLDAVLSKPSAASNVTVASDSPDSSNVTKGESNCLIAKCDQVTEVLTFNGRYPLVWGVVNWILVITLAILTFWCCCLCVSKRI